jgi:hypothetical protein
LVEFAGYANQRVNGQPISLFRGLPEITRRSKDWRYVGGRDGRDAAHIVIEFDEEVERRSVHLEVDT